MTRCFFIGHRDAPESIYPELCAAVEKHVAEYGVQEFWVGNHGAFDRMALRAVCQVKSRDPAVRLVLVLAYLPEEKTEKPAGVDELVYPQGLEITPKRFAIVRANHFAVDVCEYLITYVWQATGNARKLAEYAQGKAHITRFSARANENGENHKKGKQNAKSLL